MRSAKRDRALDQLLADLEKPVRGPRIYKIAGKAPDGPGNPPAAAPVVESNRPGAESNLPVGSGEVKKLPVAIAVPEDSEMFDVTRLRRDGDSQHDVFSGPRAGGSYLARASSTGQSPGRPGRPESLLGASRMEILGWYESGELSTEELRWFDSLVHFTLQGQPPGLGWMF